jgi:hypothetical protein
MSSTPTITPREQFLVNLLPIPVVYCATIDKDTTCIICTADPVDELVGPEDEYAVVLHDRHVFGERCIREWLSENNTCPKCREVLFEEDEDDQDSDYNSDYDDEDGTDGLADDIDMNDELEEHETPMTPFQFAGVLAEEHYDLAASMGQLHSIAQTNRFRRDFCWVRDMDLEETGGQRDDAEPMDVYLDGTAFPDFDPDILPLKLVEDYTDGTLPLDFDPEIMPMTAITSLASGRVPQ